MSGGSGRSAYAPRFWTVMATGGKVLATGQCSTTSLSKGCLTNEEFDTKPQYVKIKEEGCDKDIDELPDLSK